MFLNVIPSLSRNLSQQPLMYEIPPRAALGRDDRLNMKYKALMIDVDGTLIPNRKDGMPSEKVTDAVAKASEILHIGVATSRPAFLLRNIIDHLQLSGPSIVNGGAQVIDIKTNNVYYRQPVNKEDILRVHTIVKRFGLILYIDTDEIQIHVKRRSDVPNDTILGMFIPNVDPNQLEHLRKTIDTIPTVSTHLTPSWVAGKFCLSVGHTKATKQHGIFEVAKVLGISTREIIAVGDGYNDFPLLMACGLKVAMGNAVDDLKAIADYIAPSVEEDGVADVINKFVLN